MISQQQCQSATILIVAEPMSNRLILEGILRKASYTQVHSTQKLMQVVPLVQELNPDLICLDLNMSEINGLQVMGQLNSIRQKTYLPILILTSEGDRETWLRALDSGAKDFLRKPFDEIEALVRIHNLLEASLLHKAMSIQMEALEGIVNLRTRELKETQLDVVHRLAQAAEHRDNETGSHIVRMSHYAMVLGQACDRDLLEILREENQINIFVKPQNRNNLFFYFNKINFLV